MLKSEDAVKILIPALDSCETQIDYNEVFSLIRKACFLQGIYYLNYLI